MDKVSVDSDGYSLEDWTIRFVLNTDLGSGVRALVQPDGKITFLPPAGELKGEAFLEWIAGARDGEPYLILGQPGGSRLEARQLSIRAGVGFAWDTVTSRASGDFILGGEIKGGKLLIDFSQGDGFLTSILSSIQLESNFDLGFGFSGGEGLFFYGSSTLLIQLPAHIELGIINIKALTLSIGIDASTIPISLSANIDANLGPLQAAVEQIGVKADLKFPENQDGNLGVVDLEIGFKPQFTPPPLPFPSPKRVSLNILNESWGRIRVMGYVAVTSNTVQLGVRAELYFGFSAFNIEGHLAFDALFQFNPFFFIIEISCGVSLKVFGIGLFSIALQFSLEGPTPWRAKGYGKLKLLFFTIKANFDFTWGEKKETTLPPSTVLPLLAGEFEKISNWKAQLPASVSLLVSLRKLEEGREELVLHPIGTLIVTQRAVPLDLPLDKG